MGHTKPPLTGQWILSVALRGSRTHSNNTRTNTVRLTKVPCATERFLRLRGGPAAALLPVKMALTLRAQVCRLPSSDTPQRGSVICLSVAPSSSPVTGSRDNHWKPLQREGSVFFRNAPPEACVNEQEFKKCFPPSLRCLILECEALLVLRSNSIYAVCGWLPPSPYSNAAPHT